MPETPDEKNGEEKDEGRKTRSQMKDDAKVSIEKGIIIVVTLRFNIVTADLSDQ